jgi:hypothetical protein
MMMSEANYKANLGKCKTTPPPPGVDYMNQWVLEF